MKNNIYSFLALSIMVLLATNNFPKKTYAEGMNRIRESKEIEVVSNPKVPEFKMRLVFKEELSIGEIEGDENYMFGGRIYFNTDEDGNFYVNDWDRKRIQKYDFQGKYLLTIGRKGQGPGEFQNAWVPRFDGDNNIYVTDIAVRRISFFDKGGKFLKLIKIPIDLSNVYINSKGQFIATQSMLLEEPSGDKVISNIGLFNDKFDLIAEIHRQPEEFKAPSGRDEKSMAEFYANLLSDMAFKPSVSYLLDKKDFIYFGNPVTYKIHLYSPRGKLTRIIQREYDPIKITKKDKENFIESQESEFFRFLPPRADAIKKTAIELVKYPKYKPAYQGYTLMENGWLAVIVDSIENEYSLIDIFDKEGKYVAQFKAKIPAENFFFRNGKAYALATENDYKFVKRYNFELQEYKDNRWVGKK
jgi:hypothetical protein